MLDMKRFPSAQDILTDLENIDVTDTHPLAVICVEMLKQVAQGRNSAREQMISDQRDGWVASRVVKAVLHGQRQILCEHQLDFECNDVIVANEQVEEYAPVVTLTRETLQGERNVWEGALSTCDLVLATLAFRNERGDSYLHLHAKLGNNERVLFLLRAGADVEIEGNANDTPLALAASKGHHVIVGYLVDFGADTNVHMGGGRKTALHVACAAESLSTAVVDRLLRAGADERALNVGGRTPLDMLMSLSSEKEGFDSVCLLFRKASARRRWGWIVILRNDPEKIEGNRGSGDVGAQVRPRRSSRLSEGRVIEAVEFLVLRAPEEILIKVISFL